jgi:hypothetical protein
MAEYIFLEQDLWGLADLICQHYSKSGYSIMVEQAISSSYRFRPTIIAKRGKTALIAVEVRSSIRIENYFRDFILACERNRESVCLFLATPSDPENDSASIPLHTDKLLKELGVGLLTDDSTKIIELRRARNQALYYRLQGGAHMGKYHDRILQSIEKFNEGLPVDGIRDVTELVEESVRDIAKKASRKSLINMTAAEATSTDLDQVINCLSTSNFKSKSQTKLFENNLSSDLKSFKGARNLSHHPRNKSQLEYLISQSYERMEMAVRLIREVHRMSRKL